MKVKELIELLKKKDPEQIVLIERPNPEEPDYFEEVYTIKEASIDYNYLTFNTYKSWDDNTLIAEKLLIIE